MISLVSFAHLCYNQVIEMTNGRQVLPTPAPVLTTMRRCLRMAKRDSTPIQLPLPVEGATIEIPLPYGYVAVIDAMDADLLPFNWHIRNLTRRHYACYRTERGGIKTTHFLHRIILERMIGHSPAKGEVVDHIDNNPLNNRRSNLRLATIAENVRNSKLRSNSTSGYKGVSKVGNRWRAYIVVNKKQINLGLYATAEEASLVYREAALKYHGEFARFE